MKILKVREWLFDKANADIVNQARERLIKKAEAKGLIVDSDTGQVRFEDFRPCNTFKIPGRIVIGR